MEPCVCSFPSWKTRRKSSCGQDRESGQIANLSSLRTVRKGWRALFSRSHQASSWTGVRKTKWKIMPPPHHLIYWKRLEKNLFTRHCQKKKKKKCDSAYHTPETCWYRNKKVVPCLCIGDTVISFSIKMPWLASERMPTNRKTELKVCLLLFKVSVKFKRSRGTRFPGLHAGRMHDTWCEISGPLNIRIVWWLFCVTVKYWNTFVCFVTVHICGPKPWMPWSRQALQQGPEHGPKQRLLFREAANASAEDPSTPADEHV